jgi:hypothetical protein
MFRSRSAILVCLLIAASSALTATSISYEISGTATLSLDDVYYNSAPFLFELHGDTDDVFTAYGGQILGVSGTLTINTGLGSIETTIAEDVATFAGNWYTGVMPWNPAGSNYVWMIDEGLAAYDLVHAFGPVTSSNVFYQPTPLATDHGTVTFRGIEGTMTIEAMGGDPFSTVPEPSTMALTGFALLVSAAARRAHRKART